LDELSDLERLIAVDEIKRLKARRDRALDAKDWATYEALHAPEHVSHNAGLPAWNGPAEMIANLRRILANVVSAHHSHTPEIDFESATRATGIWAMQDHIFWKQPPGEDHWLQGFGHYHETYEKWDGRWLFTSRRLTRLHVRTSPGARMDQALPAES
jgi:hypothetical protein